MALLSDWGFFLKPGMEDAFAEWLRTNEPLMAERAPRGYEYLGTYVPLWRHASESSQYHQVWRYWSDRPPALRSAAEGHGPFTELAKQFLEFVDEARSEEESFRLYRSALPDDVTQD